MESDKRAFDVEFLDRLGFTEGKSNLGIYTLDGNQQHKLSKAEKRKRRRRRRRKVYILSSALDDCRFPQSSAIRET